MIIGELPESRAATEAPTHELLTHQRPTRSPIGSVAQGALALLSTQPLTWATSLIVVTFLPRLLGDTALGEYTLAFTFPTLLGPVVSLGLLEYLSRSLAGRSATAAREATLAWVIMTLTAIAAAGIVACLVPLIGMQIGGPLVLGAALGTLVITPTSGLLLTVLRGQERMSRFAAVSSISAAASALIPILVLAAGGNLNQFALATFIVSLACLALSWRTSGVRLPRVRITLPLLFALLPAGLPFFGWNLSMQFYGQIDRLLMGFLAPVQVVGWYAAATRITGSPIFVPMLIVTPLFPALTRCRGDRAVFRHTLDTSLRATMLATVPLCAAIAAAAPAIPSFLGWPAEFSEAVVPMTILAPNLALIGIDMMLGTALLALGLERRWLLVGVIAAVVNPTLNLIAIPFAQARWDNGGIGAATVMVVTEFVMLGGALLLMPRGLLDRSLLSIAIRVALAGGALVLITRHLLGLSVPLLVALVVGGLAFLVSVLALRIVTGSELRQTNRFATTMLRTKLARRA
jgi:O-antigen/teichoic acid export membrane protein